MRTMGYAVVSLALLLLTGCSAAQDALFANAKACKQNNAQWRDMNMCK